MSLWLGWTIVVVATVGAAAVMLAVRRWAPHDGYFVDVEGPSGVFGVLGTVFAVIMAFVILLALQSYDVARQTAGREAVAVTQLARTTVLLPEPTAATLRAELVCYARAVVEDEWAVMDEGRQSAVVQSWLDEIGITLAEYAPQDARESIAYEQWFERDTDRREGRRGRLAEATPLIPVFLWVILVVSAGVVIGYVLAFAAGRELPATQVLMVGSLTATITLSLLLVARLDRPYSSIEPTEMQRTLTLMEDMRLPAGAERGDPPCDERGTALD